MRKALKINDSTEPAMGQTAREYWAWPVGDLGV